MGRVLFENEHELQHTEKTIDSKYVQQHLANERTYLAWIRTSLAIVGLGFLAYGVLFQSTSKFVQVVTDIIGIGSVLFGGSIIAFATRDYVRKRKGINDETFRSPVSGIYLVSTSLIFITMVLMVLVGIILLTPN
ncbi:putative membrane protein [Brevibacillus sp. IT-7CA2]|uniref:YidH family protein n=1 Tax=Brevibacillus sp. IT-7CA2 TaxID=3026436 RepID=UPI0039E1867D